jgi:hypothetical protein
LSALRCSRLRRRILRREAGIGLQQAQDHRTSN